VSPRGLPAVTTRCRWPACLRLTPALAAAAASLLSHYQALLDMPYDFTCAADRSRTVASVFKLHQGAMPAVSAGDGRDVGARLLLSQQWALWDKESGWRSLIVSASMHACAL
jgi:hypothetical protein